MFQQADDDEEIAVSLIIALIVENPAAQLKLLRRLFGALQIPDTIEALLSAPDAELASCFEHKVLTAEQCVQV